MSLTAALSVSRDGYHGHRACQWQVLVMRAGVGRRDLTILARGLQVVTEISVAVPPSR